MSIIVHTVTDCALVPKTVWVIALDRLVGDLLLILTRVIVLLVIIWRCQSFLRLRMNERVSSLYRRWLLKMMIVMWGNAQLCRTSTVIGRC